MEKKQKIILGATSALTIVILILSLFFVIRSSTKKEPIIPEKKITEKAKEPTDDKQQLVTQAKIWLKATIMTKRLRYWKKIVRTDLLKHNSFFKH